MNYESDSNKTTIENLYAVLGRFFSFIEKISRNAFLRLGVALFLIASATWNLDHWYTSIEDGEIVVHHGVTLIGVFEIIRVLPDIHKHGYNLYLRYMKKQKEMQLTLLHTIEVLMEISNLVVALHRKNVPNSVVNEVHKFVDNIRAEIKVYHEKHKES